MVVSNILASRLEQALRCPNGTRTERKSWFSRSVEFTNRTGRVVSLRYGLFGRATVNGLDSVRSGEACSQDLLKQARDFAGGR